MFLMYDSESQATIGCLIKKSPGAYYYTVLFKDKSWTISYWLLSTFD